MTVAIAVADTTFLGSSRSNAGRRACACRRAGRRHRPYANSSSSSTLLGRSRLGGSRGAHAAFVTVVACRFLAAFAAASVAAAVAVTATMTVTLTTVTPAALLSRCWCKAGRSAGASG